MTLIFNNLGLKPKQKTMLQGKDINKISELKNGFTPRWLEPDFIFSSLKCFSFSGLCNCISPVKLKGYSFEVIFTILVSMPFIGATSVHSMLNGCIRHNIEAGKDTFYRLKNSVSVCWRLVLWLFAAKFRKLAENNSNYQGGIRCMVFDDTVIEKTGRFIEKISRVWNHVSQSYTLGFKLLLMGYWDGTSFIPLDFSLHREYGKNQDKPFGLKKKELKRQYNKKRDKGSFSQERAMEADMSKIECAIKMFKRAVSQGFMVDYVLMDSWFTCESLINAVLSVKKQTVHLIGMYKIVKTKFGYQDKMYTYSQIRNSLGKAKRCRKLGFYYQEAVVGYNGQQIKLFFSKQGKNGKWKVFLCTNTRLTFIRMIEIYQTRWTIEVFFNEAKQLLGLGKCQSNDFDAQVADATITMIQHILLTLKYRFECYESKAGMFAEIKEESTIQRLNQRLWGLFMEIIQIVQIVFIEVDEEQLMERLFQNEQVYQRLTKLIGEPHCRSSAA
jgi:predicted nucleic acid-binding Zn finger protein